MAQTPQFEDLAFASAAMFQAAANQATASIEDVDASLFYPGVIIPPGYFSMSPSSMVVTTTFGSGCRALFKNGVLAGGYGTVNGILSGVYSNSFASLVPGSGSVIAYLIATAAQVGQQPTLVPGPTPGHPDYDPTFVPYVAYAETLDTIALTATLTAPDNDTTIEIARITLTAGQTSISSIDTTYQVPVIAIGAPIYAADYSGIANSLYCTVPTPFLGTVIPGAVINVLVSTTNTGATTVALNKGAGSDPYTYAVLNPNGSQLAAGQLQAGAVASVAWNGTAFTLLSTSGIPTNGGSTTLTFPAAAAANGTVAASGWSRDSSGKLSQWATIQTKDSTNTTWTFPLPFVTGMLRFRSQNASYAAGQTVPANAGLTDLVSFTGADATFVCHNTNVPGTLVAFIVEAEGF